MIQSPLGFNTGKLIPAEDNVQSQRCSLRDQRSDTHGGRRAKPACADCVAQCLHYIALDSALALKDASPGGGGDPFLLKNINLTNRWTLSSGAVQGICRYMEYTV